MATKLTVKRADLIKAIEAKAKLNQASWDKLQKELAKQPKDITTAIQEAIELSFANVPSGGYNAAGSGYLKTNVISYANTFLTSIGKSSVINRSQTSTTNSSGGPRLFEAELAILNMSTDETLTLDDTCDYFAFLKS